MKKAMLLEGQVGACPLIPHMWGGGGGFPRSYKESLPCDSLQLRAGKAGALSQPGNPATYGGKGDVTREAETGLMGPQAKE